MPAPTPAIVFDLDGTLVDSLPDIIASFRHVIAERALLVPSEKAVLGEVGKPLEEMYEALVPGADPAELTAAYRRHYPHHFSDHSRPFPGVPELLSELGARGYLRLVATTKGSAMARGLVAALGLTPLLDHVQGTDGFPHKPAPDVVLRALAAVAGDGLWLVGDTTTDIEAGRAAGLRTYAVTWGTHDGARLAGARPDALAPNLDRLLDLL